MRKIFRNKTDKGENEMNISTSTLETKGKWGIRLLSFFVVFCLVFTTVAIASTEEASAASKVNVTSVKWAKKAVDLTLANAKVKFTIKLPKVNGATNTNVILTKGKGSISLVLGATGGSSTVALSQGAEGTWKVKSVEYYKRVASGREWSPGHWSGSHYINGTYVTRYKTTKLKKGTPSKNASLKVTCSPKTTTTVKRVSAAIPGYPAIFEATLKSGSKPIAGQKVKIFLSEDGNSWTSFGTGETNSNGVARVSTDPIPGKYLEQGAHSYYAAQFSGVAKKYAWSKSTTEAGKVPSIEDERNDLKITLSYDKPASPGGLATFRATIKNGEGLPAVGLKFVFSQQDNKVAFVNSEATTDANGVATVQGVLPEGEVQIKAGCDLSTASYKTAPYEYLNIE
jgi:hypothetical protein